jgi:hypothetical protein
MRVRCVRLHLFLTSAQDGGDWSDSLPGHFTPEERAPGTHWLGGWVGPKVGLDVVANKQNSTPAMNRTPVVQPVA